MTRIYPAHAYSAAPRAGCYWPQTVEMMQPPQARGEIRADVAVIGAGFTGLSAALHLAEAGVDVVVLDAESPGWGASGRNGGFCCLGGSAAPAEALRRSYGEAARREFCRAEIAAVDLARGLIARHGMEVDAHSEGETLMAHTRAAAQGFEARARQIEADYDVTPQVIGEGDLAAHGMTGPFFGAMTTPIGMALNPAKYVTGLAQAAWDAGVRIFGQSAVRRIDAEAGGYVLATEDAQIRARRIVVATNGYSSDDLPEWLRGRYLPTQSNVIVTREMSEDELAAQGWTSRQMCYDDRFFLHYFRLMPNGRMLFGMRAGLRCSPGGDARMGRVIKGHFDRMFPAWAGVEVAHYWNGLLSIARDRTPFTGPIPGMANAFCSISYHGNGVAMGSYAGALLADQILGRSGHLHPEIMKRPPKRMPLGPYRRKLMWPLYGWAALRGD
ncbi:FAD-binding oxidoreductase [Roseovarius sp.]|uniref:NAD(P)/FAD-dependent oxidoreductase n=1 Tax=Roseovarius sp. TaxID=1486281 RepID=UPI000C4F551A|nr:FAD-binding oxidoreductase [Roseovarius sp.]MAO28318.1 FAD-dependent oxidoreductase [Roseovarius sp.]MAZ22044.1 FAD-dependent oxidoreductase [Roseovarius sp.]